MTHKSPYIFIYHNSYKYMGHISQTSMNLYPNKVALWLKNDTITTHA